MSARVMDQMSIPRPLRAHLPWKASAAEQLVDMSLFDFYRFVHYHGGRRPYLSWRDPTGEKPSALPIVCMQPRVTLREGAGFARNAQWALVQYHPWQNRAESFLATDDSGEPLEPEYVKDYFRNWVESASCPWHIQEQYDHDNARPFRQARSAQPTSQAVAGVAPSVGEAAAVAEEAGLHIGRHTCAKFTPVPTEGVELVSDPGTVQGGSCWRAAASAAPLAVAGLGRRALAVIGGQGQPRTPLAVLGGQGSPRTPLQTWKRASSLEKKRLTRSWNC